VELFVVGQHQNVHVILASAAELRHVNGNNISVAVTKQYVYGYIWILVLELSDGRQRNGCRNTAHLQ